MPPGAKKRKALRKKQQLQGAIGTSSNDKGSNGDNLHGHDEHGSQDDRESDSNLSSPGSQGNEDFDRTKDPSADISPGTVKDTAQDMSGDSNVTQGLGSNGGNAVSAERGTNDKKNIVEESSYENITQTAKNVPSQDPCGDSIKEISPVVVSVKSVVSASKEVVPEKSEPAKTSSHSDLVKQKSDGKNLEKYNGKVAVAGTSKNVESVRESEVPVSAEEKRLLLPAPPAVRTSWLSCCGLFDAMTGSDR